MSELANWLDDRTGYRALVRGFLYEPIPGGSRWRYVWGSTLTFTFFVQIVTGVFLWAAYSPSAQTAWESVYYIEHVMDFGWLLRGLHHYAAHAMVVLLALHFMQVVLDGAYRAPREVNFWLGIVLLHVVLGLALTGYLLPWDQKGYYATKVATNIMGVTPLVGEELQHLVQGGTEYGHQTLTRFFALHAGILPGLLFVFLAIHLYVFRRHAITPARPHKNSTFAVVLTLLFGPLGLFYSSLPGALTLLAVDAGAAWLWYGLGGPPVDDTATIAAATGIYIAANAVFCVWARHAARNFKLKVKDSYFWPDQLLKDSVACLAVLATVLFLAVYRGAHLSAPADPAEEYTAARPEWYFLFLFQFLKFEFVEQQGLVFGAIVVPGAALTLIVLMPLFGRWRPGHWFNVGYLTALFAAVGYLTGLALYSDGNDPEFRASVAAAGRDGNRAVELARAYGIPIEGAGSLLRTDPKTQGPKIFSQRCAGCHRYNGHDGTGHQVLTFVGGERREAPQTAADLGNFGTREWIRSVLTDYKNHFAALRNASWQGEPVGEEFLNGQMADWSATHTERLRNPVNQQSLAGLVEFVVAQSQRNDIPPPDNRLVSRGREIFESGELAEGTFDMTCIDCHALTPVGEDEQLGYKGAAPLLTGYGGATWLKAFIADPGSEDYYGTTTNAMPAFGDQLTDEELELLVRWLVGDYYTAKGD